MVSDIEAVSMHLFLHTSSHPDKYNNSVNRIISKEKEREDPKRDSSKTSFQLESKSVSSVSTRNPVTTNYKFNSAYRINSTTRNTREIILCRLTPATVSSRVSKHSTRQNQVPSILQCSRPLQHKQASSNSTRQKQHSTRQPAYTQPFQQLPGAYHKEST